MTRPALLLALLLCACARGPSPEQLLTFTPGQAVPVDLAVPHLQTVLGKRITVSGLPRQREGSCLGMPPVSNNDWMLTGETECLWVNGRVPGAAMMDVRRNLSDEPVQVTGKLVQTREGAIVLMADNLPAVPPPARPAPPPPVPEPVPAPDSAAPIPTP